MWSTKTVPPFPSEHTIATEIAYFMGKKISVNNSTLRTLINELGTECQNVMTVIHRLQLPNLSDRQKAEILAEFLSAAIHLNVHCGEDFQTLVAEEMTKLSDEDEED
ncbi:MULTISPECIES: hypothetical protein [unclassified Microcoleus]|uniref:hypothetical protein n=1 Tax=unclassified Microcoleus TaxID=2642155 RepID=UPI002FD616F4